MLRSLDKSAEISYQESYDLLIRVLGSLIRSLIISYQESYDLLIRVLRSLDKSVVTKLLQNSISSWVFHSHNLTSMLTWF